MKPRILHVVGARPNFMKAAPVLAELERRGRTENVLLHSGQHYDAAMSHAFFEELGLRMPDIHLGVGSGSHGRQTAAILEGVEDVLLEGGWELVMVVGDVNSTLAAALAAAKLPVPVAHVEAGLRSHDRSMPEEINRIVVDQLSALCFTPSKDADANLLAEGIVQSRICFVGNVMVDTLDAVARTLDGSTPLSDLTPGEYALVTLHRPSNVDDIRQLGDIVRALELIAREVELVFPIHPRTQNALRKAGLEVRGARVLPPLGYKDMLSLQASARVVLTDSGGIQEETTVLGVPCLTLRSSTERPITIEQGTNTLVPVRSAEAITTAFWKAWMNGRRHGARPEGWDGKAAQRITDAVECFLA